MAEWLSDHPAVYMSPVKEPHYFSDDIYTRRQLPRIRYEELFLGAGKGHIIVGEASTTYLYSQIAVDNIVKYTQSPKFLIMVRNPVEMACALHQEKLFRGDEHVEDFQEAWNLQEYRAQGEKITSACQNPEFLLYGPFCKVGEQLARLLLKVDREQVCVIVLDDVKSSARQEYRKVLEFLNIPDDGRDRFPIHNRAKGRRSVRLARAIRVLGNVRARLGYDYPGYQLLNRVSEGISSWNTRGEERAPLPVSFRAELCEYFRRDVELLSKIIKHDLTPWTA